jgi:hypothetical protein
MKAYGYIKKHLNNDGLLELKEVTLQTTPKNLRAIAAFILKAAETLEARRKTFDHLHLQDSWQQWRKGYPDIIITK